MYGKFMGPQPIDDFLANFVPVNKACDPEQFSKVFDKMAKPVSKKNNNDRLQNDEDNDGAQDGAGTEHAHDGATEHARGQETESLKEEDMYNKFIACVAEGLCPGYTFVATPNTFDATEKKITGGQKVDMALYRNEDQPKAVEGKPLRPRWDRMALYIEFKSYGNSVKCDPFDDRTTHPNENPAAGRESARGQLIAYAAAMFARQQRTHGFSIIILGEYARIMRWDRAGAVFTERLNYVARPEKLAMFLWHFAHLDRRQQGYDDTAELIEEDSRLHNMMMKKIADGSKTSAKDKDLPEAYVLDYFKDSLDPDWPKWRLQVDVPVSPGDSAASASRAALGPTKPRYFLVGRPHFTAPGMTGRATRGYVALDEESNELVYLKDCWRVDLPDMTREGDVIQLMNNEGVQCVPTLVCHGDVEGQCTSTQKHWSRDAGKPSPFRTHQHYRLVVKEIGCPLSEFNHSEELIQVITECIMGHADAFVKAKILHRDISAGNILILRETVDDEGQRSVVTRGLLNDWDLSKSVADNNDGPRQPGRTGTWQFMSGHLLQKPWKLHELQDDLESFMHVLIYEAIRYLPHNCTDVGGFVKNFFDIASKSGNVITGGIGKMSAIGHRTLVTPLGDDLKFSEPLQSLIDELMLWFQAYYAMHDISTPEEPEAPEDNKLTYVNRKKKETLGKPKAFLASAPASEREMDKVRYEARAKKLDTHSAMVDLFLAYYNQTWPEDDKQPDQLPKGYNSDQQPPDASPTTSKRTASQYEEGATSAGGSGRRSKVARSGTRASASRG